MTTKQTAKRIEQIILLVRELDAELDGVRLPASAAAIMNGLRTLIEADIARPSKRRKGKRT